MAYQVLVANNSDKLYTSIMLGDKKTQISYVGCNGKDLPIVMFSKPLTLDENGFATTTDQDIKDSEFKVFLGVKNLAGLKRLEEIIAKLRYNFETDGEHTEELYTSNMEKPESDDIGDVSLFDGLLDG